MKEIWKDVEGYEGIYQISNLGKVKSLPREVKRIKDGHYIKKERILIPTVYIKGYLRIMLSKDGKKRRFFIHRLVASAFIPNPLNLPQVNHKDENKQNNQVDNLEWCTSKYNANFGTRNEKTREKIGKEVSQYSLDGKFIRTYGSTTEAARIGGFDNRHISDCCRGERKTHKGYIWKYD